ncbi:Protein kinase domain [Dillenia turbinata]|uniref:non-specific serine/threonine protein kinase n=1 Tax=Dillenia turbinata TaxID=194707 RepID=A0AAN8W633_9MAGN
MNHHTKLRVRMGIESYHVIELVGEGSFGKTVAMKFIPKHGKSNKDIQNLRQEIEIIRKLKHENIIEMLDSFESPQEFCVVTKFGRGELFEILEDDKCLPEYQVQGIAKQLVRALHYLHSNRIIHRDMKPQNILIGAGSVVKAISLHLLLYSLVHGSGAGEGATIQPPVDLWSLGVSFNEDFVVQECTLFLLMANLFLKTTGRQVPQSRLSWPKLLEHPFVKDTSYEMKARLQTTAVTASACDAVWKGEGKNIHISNGLAAASPDGKNQNPIEKKGTQSPQIAGQSSSAKSQMGACIPQGVSWVFLPTNAVQTGCKGLNKLENKSSTVNGAKIIGQDTEALKLILAPLKHFSGDQNSDRKLVDDSDGISSSYFGLWFALVDLFSQVVCGTEDTSGIVLYACSSCITAMLSQVAHTLQTQAVSAPLLLNETLKQVLDHANTSALVNLLLRCLETSGSSLTMASSNLLPAACEACRAIWSLTNALEILYLKENTHLFPLKSLRILSSPELVKNQRQASVVGPESAKVIDSIRETFVKSKAVQVAIYHCLKKGSEAAMSAAIQLVLRCSLHGGIVPVVLCGLPVTLPVTTIVSGGGDGTIISEIFAILTLCASSSNKDPHTEEISNSKCRIANPHILVMHSSLVLATVAQSFKSAGRNSALFMFTTSSNKQFSRLSILAHHISSDDRTKTCFQPHSASAMLALASILFLETGIVDSSISEVAVPFIPRPTTPYDHLKITTADGDEIHATSLNGMLSNWHGLGDGCVGLLHSRLKWGGPLATQQLCASGVPQFLMNLLAKNILNASPEGIEGRKDCVGLSPVGVVWTVSLIYLCLFGGSSTFQQILLRKEHIKLMSELISDGHLQLVKEWFGPGGGRDGVRDVVNSVIDLLAFPFVAVQDSPSVPSAMASMACGSVLSAGIPSGKVCVDDRDMLKAIREHMKRYIHLLMEVGMPGIILRCVDHLELKDLG